MTTIAVAPSLLSAAIVAAAIDEGLLPGRRVLVTVNVAPLPEIVPGLAEAPGFHSLASRFDGVVDINAACAPHLPSSLLTERSRSEAVREEISRIAGEPVTRVVIGSPDSHLSWALARMFSDARIDVVADRMVSYGHTPRHVKPGESSRADRVFFVDLVPGARPLLLAHAGAVPTAVPVPRVQGVLANLAGTPTVVDVDEAWLLGERLAPNAALEAVEQESLYVRMLDAAADAGYSSVAFKPHPLMLPSHHLALTERAAQRAIGFRVLTGLEPVELMLARTRPRAVIGCSSTALGSASALYEVPAFTTETGELVDAVTSLDELCSVTRPEDYAATGGGMHRRLEGLAASVVGRRIRSARNVIAALQFRARL